MRLFTLLLSKVCSCCSSSGEMAFGPTNLGNDAIQSFVLKHTCNSSCKKLGLSGEVTLVSQVEGWTFSTLLFFIPCSGSSRKYLHMAYLHVSNFRSDLIVRLKRANFKMNRKSHLIKPEGLEKILMRQKWFHFHDSKGMQKRGVVSFVACGVFSLITYLIVLCALESVDFD